MAGIDIDGMQNLENAFNDIADINMTQTLGHAAAFIAAQAKLALTQWFSSGRGEPGEDGTNLRMSIQSEAKGNEAQVYSTLPYAPYVEVGTGLFAGTEPDVSQYAGTGRHDVPWTYYNEKYDQFFKTSGMKPRPFLSKALNANRKTVEEYVKKKIDESLHGR